MSAEPKTEAEKGPFRFPALTPKRRFRANAPAQEGTAELNEESPGPAHRQKFKRSGRVILRRPSQDTSFARVAPTPPTSKSYAP
jgi:hypothetical protein